MQEHTLGSFLNDSNDSKANASSGSAECFQFVDQSADSASSRKSASKNADGQHMILLPMAKSARSEGKA